MIRAPVTRVRVAWAAHALVAAWLVASALALPPTFVGDSGEYALMTESFFRHASPEIRYGDIMGVARAASGFLRSIEFAEVLRGYFPAQNGSLYSYHFWAYSLLAVPFRALAPLLGLNPLKAHSVVNALLLVFTLGAILRSSAVDGKAKAALCALTVFSPILPFVLWPHPEVFTYSFVTLALLWEREGRRYWPVFAAALATLQSPTLIWLALWLWLKGAGVRVGGGGPNVEIAPPLPDRLLRASAAALPVLLPAAFFYWNFGTASLIAQTSTSSANLSPAKALELFTDLNLGLLPYVPLTLLLWLAAGLWSLARPRTGAWIEVLLLPAVIALSSTLTNNWNHGTCGPSRYAVWLLPFLFFGVLRLMPDRGNTASGGRFVLLALVAAAVLSQATLALARGGVRAKPDDLEHSYAARWVLRHHPRLYNPSPEIFVERTTHLHYEPPREPVVYVENGRCFKALARRKDADRLRDRCGAAPGAAAFSAGPAGRREWRYVDY